MIAYLLENGANIDQRDATGNTPLACAVLQHHPNAAQLLVDRGAHVHSTNSKGQSPASLGLADLLVVAKKLERESKRTREDGEESPRKRRKSEDYVDLRSDDEESRPSADYIDLLSDDEEDGYREQDFKGTDRAEDFDWASHLAGEYQDEESEAGYSDWRDLENEGMLCMCCNSRFWLKLDARQSGDWMDEIAEQAKRKFSRAYVHKKEQEKKNEERTTKEENWRKLLEEEVRKDREWREKVKKAAAMNNSEKDEEKWNQFENMQLQSI